MHSRKDSAITFLELAAVGRAREAFTRYAARDFWHHNPFFAGDADTLMTAMDDNARQNPGIRFEVLRALEDGDLVAVHSHIRQTADDRGAAAVHIFRFEGDRIAEAWDVAMMVPAESVNANGMF
jgi:predicted SnoaL-like aldol condensation-catalyzing enzyme